MSIRPLLQGGVPLLLVAMCSLESGCGSKEVEYTGGDVELTPEQRADFERKLSEREEHIRSLDLPEDIKEEMLKIPDPTLLVPPRGGEAQGE